VASPSIIRIPTFRAEIGSETFRSWFHRPKSECFRCRTCTHRTCQPSKWTKWIAKAAETTEPRLVRTDPGWWTSSTIGTTILMDSTIQGTSSRIYSSAKFSLRASKCSKIPLKSEAITHLSHGGNIIKPQMAWIKESLASKLSARSIRGEGVFSFMAILAFKDHLLATRIRLRT